MSLSVSVQKRR